MILHMNLPERGYDIVVEEGCLKEADSLLDLDRKVLIVTDDGVPSEYAALLSALSGEPLVVTVPSGEGSKSLRVWEQLLDAMLSHGFRRTDAACAVGGGVVGDLTGFAAASYMRGIDFYNLPTTVLSQVDSSIGGKTAVNFGGIKNIVGAFCQPAKVLVDPALLRTLPRRQIANGLFEALKMALLFDPALFSLFENEDPFSRLPEIIEASLRIKKKVVEEDEKESGLRKSLNFGHTIGHGIESLQGENGLLHGECVAYGMLPMCSDEVRNRLLPVLRKLGLPDGVSYDREKVFAAMLHDKKAARGGVDCVFVRSVGSFSLERLSEKELFSLI